MLCKTPQCSALGKIQKRTTTLKSKMLTGKCFSRWVWKADFSAQFSSQLPVQFQAGHFISESVACKAVTQTSFLCMLLYLLPALLGVSGRGEHNFDGRVP